MFMWPGTLFDTLGALLFDFDFVFVFFSPWGSHQHFILPCVFPRRDLLETKAMELMPNETKVRMIPEVCIGLADLGRSSLAAFVSSSSRGGFDAAAAMMNQIERAFP